MVTNLDIIVKKYPELVIRCLSNESNIAVDKYTGKATVCGNCVDCIFAADTDPCEDSIQKWLSKEVKVKEKESKETDNSNNTKNSNGEITW